MNHRRLRSIQLAVVAVTLAASAGCGVIGGAGGDNDPTPAAATPAGATPAGTGDPSSASGLGDSVKDSGDLPDPCTLLTKAQVSSLTGKSITQVDPDGGKPGDASRFCQWQLSGGQLAVFLSRTTKDEFDVQNPESKAVDGIGDDAFTLAGHLYVLYGTVQLDVYARGGSDQENLDTSKETVALLLPKI
jgi:hypothetical protein